MLSFILLQLPNAVDSANLAQSAAATAQIPDNLWALAVKGGVVMIPIGIMFVFALYLAIERYLTIRNAAKIDNAFMSNIKDMVLNDNILGAKTLCTRTNTPIARMIEKGLSRIGKPIQDIDSSIENVGRMEIYKIEKNVGFLATIAGLAPMFGFLGTIFGVIQMFYKISLANSIQIDIISGGLYVKMVSSAAGLLLGIFAFASYHYLMLKIDRVANKMEAYKLEFIDILQQPA
ncbi:MAG: MotA/TolQ/ExbB proton channel family protein [bacterium]|nr:MotA/TolQ/ExbB proton channel family protein [bacterium]